MAVDLTGRPLLRAELAVGIEGEVGARVRLLPASSYCLTRSPRVLRLTPCGWEYGEREGLGEISVALKLAVPDELGKAEVSR